MAESDRQPRKGIFTYEEALKIFPRVKDLTTDTVKKATLLSAEMLALPAGSPRREILEQDYGRLFHGWAREVESLGCEVKGAWLVDFDNGEGYYCWKYPEERLEYFHDYTAGFSGRMKIQ
ncbi:MAG: DUF2203 domain-containing protein [Nitrospirae bacterium]|nr:DUF2203 domain-containing protein [Nitrospirota bacterium]